MSTCIYGIERLAESKLRLGAVDRMQLAEPGACCLDRGLPKWEAWLVDFV